MRQQLTRGTVWFLGLTLCAIAVVASAGFGARHAVDAAFTTSTYVRAARLEDVRMERLQLDEETGIRGYAATGSRLFLEPYFVAQPQLKRTFDRLALHLREVGIPEAQVLDDARRTNAEWLQSVAAKVLANDPRSLQLQERGKSLVDRFRADVATINAALIRTEERSDAQTRDGISLITLITSAAMIGLALSGYMLWIVRRRARSRLRERDAEALRLRAAYEAEKRMADALSEAFLQKRLPTPAGLAFSATYVPAREERKVGGDWYEGVELTEGRVMFAIGDVAGHGLEAAAAMNSARQSLLAAALIYQDPARILERVNAELLHERGRMVTAVVGVADARRYEFTYAAAGHPPPVLLEPGREPRVLACGGVPLGVIAGADHYRTSRVQTVPGAMLVLYTDGAVEQTRDPIEGERILLDAVRFAAQNESEEPAHAIRRFIFSGHEADDDVAILTLSFSASQSEADGLTQHARISAAGSHGLSVSESFGSGARGRRQKRAA